MVKRKMPWVFISQIDPYFGPAPLLQTLVNGYFYGVLSKQPPPMAEPLSVAENIFIEGFVVGDIVKNTVKPHVYYTKKSS